MKPCLFTHGEMVFSCQNPGASTRGCLKRLSQEMSDYRGAAAETFEIQNIKVF